MRNITLRNGQVVPAAGLGTWHMGEHRAAANDEIAALQLGIDLGMTLVDTAEMYGDGGAEEVVGRAIAKRRDDVFLVSKVYPHNASRAGVAAACERSLRRLGTDRLDLYLLHWRGGVPLAETVAGFEALQRQGKIRAWGVSNFDVDDMAELAHVSGGAACVSNQVLYHLGERGIEWQLLADCRRDNVMVMAYSPLGQGEILDNKALADIAAKHNATAAAVALAFVLRQPGVVAIPKAATAAHVRANATALTLDLDATDFAVLDVSVTRPAKVVVASTLGLRVGGAANST